MFAFKLLTSGIAGRIYEDKMIWQPLYQHPPTVLIATGEDRICMELEGAKHGGIVAYSASSARMLINWSDGYLDWKVMGEKNAQRNKVVLTSETLQPTFLLSLLWAFSSLLLFLTSS